MLKWILRSLGIGIAILVIGLSANGAMGWVDAARDAPALQQRAAALRAGGKGPDSLGAERLAILLAVQDPGFYDHAGVDLSTPGAGLTTVTQSVAKRMAFEDFKPGLRKLRQTTYALSLERRLTKDDILTLFLAHVPMGRAEEGWIEGFHKGAEVFFGGQPADIPRQDFIALTAVMIAPGRLKLAAPDPLLKSRIRRIARLADGACAPVDLRDVWLRGCAQRP
ncbi:MAG: transglycosylase domain-containing protein [Alphaproteobacteria bacterium]